MRHTWLTFLKFRSGFLKRSSNSRTKIAQRLELEFLEGRLVPAATRYPDFALPDLHPSTPTSGQNVGPATFRGAVSGYYFTNPG